MNANGDEILCKWCHRRIEKAARVCDKCGRHQGWLGFVSAAGIVIGVLVAIFSLGFSGYSAYMARQERVDAEAALRAANTAQKGAEAAQARVEEAVSEANKNLINSYAANTDIARYTLMVCAKPVESGGPQNPYAACIAEFNEYGRRIVMLARGTEPRLATLSSYADIDNAVLKVCEAIEVEWSTSERIRRRTMNLSPTQQQPIADHLRSQYGKSNDNPVLEFWSSRCTGRSVYGSIPGSTLPVPK